MAPSPSVTIRYLSSGVMAKPPISEKPVEKGSQVKVLLAGLRVDPKGTDVCAFSICHVEAMSHKSAVNLSRRYDYRSSLGSPPFGTAIREPASARRSRPRQRRRHCSHCPYYWYRRGSGAPIRLWQTIIVRCSVSSSSLFWLPPMAFIGARLPPGIPTAQVDEFRQLRPFVTLITLLCRSNRATPSDSSRMGLKMQDPETRTQNPGSEPRLSGSGVMHRSA
jgi:hypothetical protein